MTSASRPVSAVDTSVGTLTCQKYDDAQQTICAMYAPASAPVVFCGSSFTWNLLR